MNASLDALSMVGSELSTTQLDDVDGGFVMLIIAGLALADGVLWGYILTH
ncbi:MAG TPA: hypothetical protein VFP05_13845 [Thermomicrobiales bacterium]|nr:hypothetical protein [Thermomicrobiales bacterium]